VNTLFSSRYNPTDRGPKPGDGVPVVSSPASAARKTIPIDFPAGGGESGALAASQLDPDSYTSPETMVTMY